MDLAAAIKVETQNNWGVFMKRVRKKFGWNQNELADVLGVSIGSVKNWECGATYPPYFLKFALFYIEGRTIITPGHV